MDMKHPLRFLTLFFALAGILEAQAQTSVNKWAAGLSTDFVTIGSADPLNNLNWNNGGKFLVSRYLNKHLNVGSSFAINSVDKSGFEPTERTFLDFDVFGQYKILRSLQGKESPRIDPFVYGGLGAMRLKSDFAGLGTAGIGANVRLVEDLHIQLLSTYNASFGSESFLQNSVGIVHTLGKASDKDGDGIQDSKDKCPDVAGLPALQGCPDTDNDGITDADDECPEQAGPATFKGCPDTDNDGIADKTDECPDKAGLAEFNGCPDTDKDGIADSKDKCPDVAGLAEFDGCPDTDKDGLIDSMDACPDVAGPKSAKGCPDKDGDTVPDKDDKCPDVAGSSANGGCPEPKPEEKKPEPTAVRARIIYFSVGSSNLTDEAKGILDEVAENFKKAANPDITLFIEGHADNTGGDDLNQRISDARAEKVRSYLLRKGISTKQMQAKGYGETQPAADNSTDEGRNQNRRVVVNLKNK